MKPILNNLKLAQKNLKKSENLRVPMPEKKSSIALSLYYDVGAYACHSYMKIILKDDALNCMHKRDGFTKLSMQIVAGSKRCDTEYFFSSSSSSRSPRQTRLSSSRTPPCTEGPPGCRRAWLQGVWALSSSQNGDRCVGCSLAADVLLSGLLLCRGIEESLQFSVC